MAEDRTGVVARLDALEAAWKGATPGLWHVMRSADDRRAYVITTARVVTDSAGCTVVDAAAIVAEHNSYGHLLAAVRGVLESHVPSHAYCVVCDKDRDVEALGNAFPCDHYASFCRECDFAWPCRTVSTAAAALGEA